MKFLTFSFLLCCSLSAFGQLTDEINEQAQSYFNSFPEERIYVHLSDTEILAGERLWFRIYPYSPKSGQPTRLSKVAYVELMDSEGVAVTRARVLMTEKGGDGSIELPADLDAGYYQLRSYTQWMRNFQVGGFFHTRVKVINTFKQLGLKSVPDSAQVAIRFFPEGGDIVAGNLAKVAVLSENLAGQPVIFTGEIVNRDSAVVARLTTDAYGMGAFEFTPETGQSYELRTASTDSTEIRFPLPAVRPTGITMRVEEAEDAFDINISERGTIPGNLYLAVFAQGEVISVQNQPSQGDATTFRLAKTDLPAGVSQLTLMNNEGIPVCERLIYKTPDAGVSLTADLSQTSFTRREQVELKVGLSQGMHGDVSVSVHLVDPSVAAERIDYPTYRWLASEVRLPQRLIPVLIQDQGPNLDLVLQIYGWRRYRMEDIRGSGDVEFIPEFRGPVLMGNSSIPNEVVFVGYPDSLAQGGFVRTDTSGDFALEMPDLIDTRNVIAIPQSSGELKIHTPFESTYLASASKNFEVSSDRLDYLLKRSESVQVENIFNKAQIPSMANRESFYGTPTVKFYLDDYTRFPVMEEVMREYVYGVFVRKRNDNFVFKVIDDSRNETMEDAPLILLDGIPIDNANDIMSIDPGKIKRIDVYRRRYGLGTTKVGGVIAFYSYRSDLANYVLPASVLQERYEGVQSQKEFYTPPQDLNKRMPDFRSLLYWNPAIWFDGQTEITFPTSDVRGTFEVVVQGRTDTGEPVSATRRFTVE